MKTIWILIAMILGGVHGHAALLYPSVMAPVRSAIVDEISILTNNPALTPEERRQLRLLTQARRNIDRAGRPSLFGDIQVLASVASSVTQAFPNDELDPLLQFAIADYAVLLADTAASLQDTIEQLPPSTASTLASNTVADASASLVQLDPFADVTTGIRTVTRVATRLRSAEGFISRARSVVNANRMSAFVDGRRFTATSTGISATYNPGTQTLSIFARELLGGFPGNRSIQLVITGVSQGATTHSLGAAGAGSYATYSASSPTNTVVLNSSSGNALVTLNLATGVATGRFSFEAGTPLNGQVRVTGGDFSIRLPVR